MKLTPSQAKVIVAAQLNADLPVKKLRSRLGMKEHTVRYALHRVQQEGVLERRCFLNLFRLGYLQHEVFISLVGERPRDRELLLAYLQGCDRISWIGRLGGEYQYGFNLCSRNMGEVVAFFEKLAGSFGTLFLEKAIALRVGLTYFGNRYLAPDVKPGPALEYRASGGVVAIDPTDQGILGALSHLGYRSSYDLARDLKMSQSTVDYRLRRLRTQGVIVGSYYTVRHERVGILSFLCLVALRGVSGVFRDRALEFCGRHPQVVVLVEAIGSWDFEFVIEAFSAHEAMQTSEALIECFGRDLLWIKLMPIFSFPKVSEYPMRSEG